MTGDPQIDRDKLIGLYARLRGLREAIGLSHSGLLDGHYATDMADIIKRIGSVLGEDVSHFAPPPGAWWQEGNSTYTNAIKLQGRLIQAITYLEAVHHVGSEVVEVGTLFNAIKDEELRSRCADLLSASSNFDRAINQATLVLEDRIRRKAGGVSEVGVALVRKVIPQAPSSGALRISSVADEQEGIGHICAGIMSAFRNPTHHHLSNTFTREEALKLCAFIDNLLHIIDLSVMVK